MIEIVIANGTAERAVIAAMRARAASANAEIEQAVSAIMDRVREKGFEAVEAYSLRFDGTAPYEISREKLDQAYAACAPALIAALERSAANIRDYNEKLLVETREWTSPGV